MLRRPPTQIQLTAEDIAQYADNRLQRLATQAAIARQEAISRAELEALEAGTQRVSNMLK